MSSIDYMIKHRCAVVTPGYNKNEVIEICRNLAPLYDQVVICAYPPLAKEILDLGREQGIKWPKLKPKFIFGGEAFSEELRDYVLDVIGSRNPLLDTMNTIGSADAMIIGHETPISIALRRMIHADEEMHNDILGVARMPTVAQYYPWQKYLEVADGELLITTDGTIPFIRYNIHDAARVLTYDELNKRTKIHGKAAVEALPANMRDKFHWRLPFVFLYGKSINAVKLYGANVYPENIKEALERKSVATLFTGKFRMEVYFDKHHSQRFRLLIELSPRITSKQIKLRELQTEIVKTICKNNTEFKSSYQGTGSKMVPSIILVPYGQFDLTATRQNKHKYV